MKKKIKYLIPIGITLVFVILAVFIVFGMNGQKVTKGSYPDDAKDTSLKCTSNSLTYPYFVYDNSSSRKITINALFGDEQLKSISLIYELSYSDARTISASESHNHAEMNKSFAKDGLDADAFSARYMKSDDTMSLTLYATQNDLTNNSLKYFMMNGLSSNVKLDQLKNNYTAQGFSCERSK